MFLADLHTAVTEQYRHLIDGHTSQQHLDGEGIAQHVGMAPFMQRREFEHPSQCALPIGHGCLQQPIASPEKVLGVAAMLAGIPTGESPGVELTQLPT